MKKILRLFFVLTFAIIAFEASTVQAQLPDVCQAPENILPNCNFDSGLDRWQKFVEAGGADFSVLYGGGECHAPLCPAAYIVTHDHFVGGLYQQVAVTPGNTYYANIIWLVFDSLVNDASVNGVVGGIGRRIGIDPFGGTDPSSPNIVWSQDNWRNDCKICGVEEVTATAQADVITVFLRLDDTWRLRAAEKGFAVPPSKDQFWIDDIGLKQVGESEAVASVAAAEPTEAPPPPTDTPLPPPPADTPEAEPTAELAQAESLSADLAPETDKESVPNNETEVSREEEQIAASVEPPTPTNTIAPPPTLTPTHTPQPTATRLAQLRATNVPTSSARTARLAEPQPVVSPAAAEASLVASVPSVGLVGLVGTTACIGGVFVVVMAVVLSALTWLYRLGWGNINDDEMSDTNGNIEEIDVDVVE